MITQERLKELLKGVLMKKILTALFFLLPAIAQAQIVGTLPFQLQNGTTADATQVMADFNKILNDVNINGAKNGVNTDITALNALVTPITPAQGGSTVYTASTSGGSANAQTVVTPSPVGFTLSTGKRITFIAGFTNTGAMTLNVNSTGVTNVFRYTPSGPIALIGGEVVANNYIEAVYDGTRFLLYTNASTPGYGLTTNITAAGTTDLGTSPSHNIQINGTTTITSFGSTAVLTYPIYRVLFANVLTLTNSAALALPGAANITTATNDTAVVQYFGSGNWQVISYNKFSGAATATAAPTRQAFLSGSGTYTTPANVRYIRVRMVGGGGGGGGANNSAASTSGNQSTFNAGAISAGGGAATSATVAGGAGGSASGANVFNIPGGSGTASNGAANGSGGPGGNSCLGGGGGGGLGNATGLIGATNSGGGGGGGGALGSVSSGGGGGAGGCVEHVFAPPAASYTYVVGTGGAGATGTTGGAGGAGAAGIVLVEEYY